MKNDPVHLTHDDTGPGRSRRATDRKRPVRRPFAAADAASILLLLMLAACAETAAQSPATTSSAAGSGTAAPTPATADAAAPTDPRDPYERLNRRVLDVNFQLDDAVLKPAATFYRDNVGPWTRARVRNVLQNAAEPGVTVNALLQGRPVAAGTSFMRFMINSTLGLGGLFDLEPIGGPPRQNIDFGQTLYRWGVPDGPYLMIPVAGPSTPREFAGTVVGGFMDPVSWLVPIGYNLGRAGALGLDERAENIETLEEIRKGSLDPYARLRSLWRQHRDAELGITAPTGEGLDVLDDPGAPGR